MAATNTPFRPANLWFPANNQQNPNDSDRKIFIAAVLSLAFVVVLVFLLHLYIRHLLLRRRSVPNAIIRPPPTITITPQTSGLAPSLLAAIPAFAYETSAAGSAECAVCLSLVEEGEAVRILPNCKHVFHVGCIDMWLHAHCTCPVCRAGVEPIKKVAVAVDGGGVLRASAEETRGSGPKEGSSGSQRLAVSISLRRMLSSRERSGGRLAVVGNGVAEDVERQ